MIKITPIAAFTDNYIWCLYDDQSNRALVVDPGDGAPVQTFLAEHGLTLEAILITHHHFDHTGGIESLLAATERNIAVYGPSTITSVNQPLQEGDNIEVLTLNFDVLAIPGHTLDHIAYYCDNGPTEPLVFCGDTLFAGGCGRVFEGTGAMMAASLGKLAALPATTAVYCAHEYTLANLAFAKAVEPNSNPLHKRIIEAEQKRQQDLPTVPSTIAMELATNPFLRCSNDDVIAAARTQTTNAEDSVAVFCAIRGWKDNF